MATRSLTDTYRNYRNSGTLKNYQKKPLFKQKKPAPRSHHSDDTIALVSDDDTDQLIPTPVSEVRVLRGWFHAKSLS